MTDKKNKLNSDQYNTKKRFFEQVLTVYGRKPVLEALQNSSIEFYRLHLADSNKKSTITDEIINNAKHRSIEIVFHSRHELSRISKNSKQDQGVAADIICKDFLNYQDFLNQSDLNESNSKQQTHEIIALDRITNPQNLGMIIRSVCASGISGLLLPKNGCAKIDPLVIKASAGTIFRTPILRCDDLATTLRIFKQHHYNIYGLSSHANKSINSILNTESAIYVLGNETDGVSKEVSAECNSSINIPMCNNVESLNVAVTASLLAFRKQMSPQA